MFKVDNQHSLYDIMTSGRPQKVLGSLESEIRFLLVTAGSASVEPDQGAYVLKEGQALFFNSGSVRQINIAPLSKDTSYMLLRFHPADLLPAGDIMIRNRYVDSVLRAPGLKSLFFHDMNAPVIQALYNVMELYALDPPDIILSMNIVLLQLWQNLYRAVCDELPSSTGVSHIDSERGSIMQEYVVNNYQEKITIDDIAHAANISRSECCRLFRKLYQMSPIHYLTSYRLLQSLKLLNETDMSINQIALQVGFGSGSYFTECFKKEMNCSPLKYRQVS